MYDKKGNRVNRIRHIRCFTGIKNPLKIKEQIYKSNKDYKNYLYADMGDLYAMCRYENPEKSKTEFRIWSLFDISENRKCGLEDIPSSITHQKSGVKLCLAQTIKVGDMLLLYKDSVYELKEMDTYALANRLYVVRGFENDGNRIRLLKHDNALPASKLKGESIKDFSSLPEFIRCGIRTLKFIQNGVEFYLDANGVQFNGKKL